MIPDGFGEQYRQAAYESPKYRDGRESVRYRAVRFEMLEHYGPACVFTGKVYPNLDGLGSGIDVGHLWPRGAGGLCIIQNAAPMTMDVNHQWDHGLISLRNNGDVLIASRAGSDTRALFSHIARIQFPKEVQYWPDAQYLERHRDEIFEKGPVASTWPSVGA